MALLMMLMSKSLCLLFGRLNYFGMTVWRYYVRPRRRASCRSALLGSAYFLVRLWPYDVA